MRHRCPDLAFKTVTSVQIEHSKSVTGLLSNTVELSNETQTKSPYICRLSTLLFNLLQIAVLGTMKNSCVTDLIYCIIKMPFQHESDSDSNSCSSVDEYSEEYSVGSNYHYGCQIDPNMDPYRYKCFIFLLHILLHVTDLNSSSCI